VLLLLYFHTAAIFYTGELGLYQERPVESCNELLHHIHQWHMPLSCSLLSDLVLGLRSHFGQQVMCRSDQAPVYPFPIGTGVTCSTSSLLPTFNPTYQDSYLQFYPQFFNGIRPQGILSGRTYGS